MKFIMGLILFVSVASLAADKKPAVNLTKEEKQFVEEARKAFKNGKNKPLPSFHMQDKMQSSVKQ